VLIFAGKRVGLTVRLAPGNVVREMLVRVLSLDPLRSSTNLPVPGG